MDTESCIKRIFERDMGKVAVSVSKCANETRNINSVYRIETADRPYILKLFRSAGYPEEGKPLLVSKLLSEHNIPHATIYSYKSHDDDFPNGYIIEEFLTGITADRLEQNEQETCLLYRKLAIMTAELHRIKLTKHGFFVCGKPDCSTFTEHIEKNFIYGINRVQSVYTNKELDSIKEILIDKLKQCDNIQPCLCHIDLQPKNILVDGDRITLIDWDDARSFPAIVEIARLTLLIELAYDKAVAEDAEKARIYKNAFFDSYQSEGGLTIYDELESALHVWHGLVILNFFIGGMPHFLKIKTVIDSKIKQMVGK